MMHERHDESTTKAYMAEYRDDNGVVNTTLYSSGTTINVTLRGVQFEGRHLANLAPIDGTDMNLFSQFPSNVLDSDNWLESFTMHLTIPITVVTDKNLEEDAVVELEVTPDPNISNVFLTFRHQRQHLHRLLEYGLDPTCTPILHIKYTKTCLNCIYGHYWPFGNENNWDMICFKLGKSSYQQYLQAKKSYKGFVANVTQTKAFEILHTQETYVCHEFEPKMFDHPWH